MIVDMIAPTRTATVSMNVLPTNFSTRVATRNSALRVVSCSEYCSEFSPILTSRMIARTGNAAALA